jgi:5'-deoxynucleotidase YfbR-like HD superfamily hydrolase
MNVYEAWQSGKTKRKHTMQTLFSEHTAEHTWGMCFLLLRYVPEYSKALMNEVIVHDVGEAGTADIPAHVCWAMPELKKAVEVKEREYITAALTVGTTPPVQTALTDDEQLMLEVLDRAEFVLSCWREAQMGNSLTLRPITRAYNKVVESTAAMTPNCSMQRAANVLSSDLRACVRHLDHDFG